ncbi:hypothetical protein DMN91_006854 [Ooceraea biroi]|uniref:Uncharacterized protein n=1 Tax=Ooceraea biroi TaxID=2015173 RepID=A0A026VTH0_OOCBI|nr:uncharacterized protein LOC105286823 [Ooceraea biroi]XP_011350359.1 uncharacterized protein LOC105286823 [Ooceraea biroi]EZA47088.1 hypothetical protein X777_16567 [Ooceraea biroi]RLU20247.1 hypothetical protein DMN91_006854 [Ooceraea biroi]
MIDVMMFGNKKNSLPRPHLPSHDHVLEDLGNATVDDVAFKIIGNLSKNSYDLTSINNSDEIYKKVKTYLNTKQRLRQLEHTLKNETHQVKVDNEEIRKLANDIKKQAQAALITY